MKKKQARGDFTVRQGCAKGLNLGVSDGTRHHKKIDEA